MGCILFEIHGSKFKPDPFSNLGQASVVSKPHSVFFLGIGKDTLNRFFSPVIQSLHTVGMPYVFNLFKIVEPDVLCYGFLVFGVFGALIFLRR